MGMALWRRKQTPSFGTGPETVPVLPEAPAPDENGRRDLAAHQAWVLAQIAPLPALGLGLLDATGLTLCEDLRAQTDLPPHPRAEVPGFAVDAAGMTQEAGRRAGMAVVEAGEALPEGTDTVVPRWLTRSDHSGVLRVTGRVRRGDWVRHVGDDAREGEPIARAGEAVTPWLAARLAEAGYERVLARPRVRVAVLSLEPEPDEATVAGASAAPASYLVTMALRADGATAWRLAVTGGAEALRTTLNDELIRADLLVCCGGLSGPQALLPGVLADLGPVDVCDLALAPGDRYGFARVGDESIPLLAVPGMTTAGLVAYLALVRPVLRALAGATPDEPLVGRALVDLPGPSPVRRFVLATLTRDGSLPGLRPWGSPTQARLRDLVTADAFMELPAGGAPIGAGQSVAYWPLPY